MSPARTGHAGDAVAAVRPLEPRPRRSPHLRLLLFLCCAVELLVIVDVAMVTVALPSIGERFELSTTGQQWVMNAFMIAFAGLIAFGARAAAVLGSRRVFVGGLLIFGVSALVGGLATSEAWLIAARAVQGVGAAMVVPASLAVLTTAFPEGRDRRRALRRWGAMVGAGAASGLLLGGVVTETLTWRWVLIISSPIAAVAVIAAIFLVPARAAAPKPQPKLDVLAALALCAGLVLAALGLASSSTRGVGAPSTVAPLAAGTALLAAFAYATRRAVSTAGLTGFTARALAAISIAMLLMGAATLAMWFFVSVYLQQVLMLSPIGAGLALLPMGLTIITFGQLVRRAAGRVAPGRMLGAGLALVALGMALFSRISADGSYAADVIGPGVLVSAGIGISYAAATLTAMAASDGQRPVAGAALFEGARYVGAALGLALLVSVAISYGNGLQYHEFLAPVAALNDGFRRGFELGAVLALVGALLAYWRAPRLKATAPSGRAEQAR